MAQNEQTTEEHSTLEQQSPKRKMPSLEGNTGRICPQIWMPWQRPLNDPTK